MYNLLEKKYSDLLLAYAPDIPPPLSKKDESEMAPTPIDLHVRSVSLQTLSFKPQVTDHGAWLVRDHNFYLQGVS